MVRLSSPNITGRCPNFWPCGKWCNLHLTNMPLSSSSKSLIASRVMLPNIHVTHSFWAVIVSQVVVLVGATVVNLVVGDGGRFWVVNFISLTVFVDKTLVSYLLNLGNHRCQCKGHDHCRELCLL